MLLSTGKLKAKPSIYATYLRQHSTTTARSFTLVAEPVKVAARNAYRLITSESGKSVKIHMNH
jgi:hypothetical protein